MQGRDRDANTEKNFGHSRGRRRWDRVRAGLTCHITMCKILTDSQWEAAVWAHGTQPWDKIIDFYKVVFILRSPVCLSFSLFLFLSLHHLTDEVRSKGATICPNHTALAGVRIKI